MRQIIAIMAVLIATFSCEKIEGSYEELTVKLSEQQAIPEDSVKIISSKDFKVIIPKGWRQTITTDSSLTIDNSVVDTINGYNIITVMSHKSTAPVDDRDLQIAFQRYLKQHENIDQKDEQFIKNRNETVFIAVTVDSEEIELLDSNILVTYSFVHPRHMNRWITVNAQSYGTERFADQEDMKKIINSITWR